MISREKYKQILVNKLKRNPAVVIVGPRQVGKTTIAKDIGILLEVKLNYFDLESQNTLDYITQDQETFLESQSSDLLVLDEVQNLPSIFSNLRSVIDKNRINAKYLLLGSANPALVRGVSESLAGRVSYMQLMPLSLLEVGLENQNVHWLRGGFPRAYLSDTNEEYIEWTNDYIRSYIERDINMLFNINLNTSIIRRLWIMLAHMNGSMLNSADLGRSLGITANTVNKYIEVLEGAYLIKKLLPWYVNVGKRLVKSPKVYLADTGLLHALLSIKSFDALMVHPIIGASWENYVIQQIEFVLQSKYDIYFYRTHNGSEIDLIIVDGVNPLVAVEIKNSNNPSISKGFYLATNDLNISRKYIVTRDQSYPDANAIKIKSLSDFLKIELPSILELN